LDGIWIHLLQHIYMEVTKNYRCFSVWNLTGLYSSWNSDQTPQQLLQPNNNKHKHL
jgi:hypothetical protein